MRANFRPLSTRFPAVATFGAVLAGPIALAACLLLLPGQARWFGILPLLFCLSVMLPRARAGATAPAAQPLEAAEAGERQTLPPMETRGLQRHSVTGFETREPLIACMERDGKGILAVISFSDFDRLCAFDPHFAERALRQYAVRIARMVGDRHFLAHVDRSYFALWLGPDVALADAEAYLVAVRYALSDALNDEACQLLPDTRVSHGLYDPALETAAATVSRLIAACACGSSGLQAVELVDQTSGAAERDRYILEQALRGALDRQEYRLCYQPQVDSKTGRVLGAEALLRWDDPIRGLVPPSIFVPILEKAGLIEEVGLFVLNAACRDARRWRKIASEPVTVAVNVSGHQLESDDLQLRIERTLDVQGLAPNLLEIELTETAAAADVQRVAQLFDGLSKRGIHIAIDDFGTGFSSLSALRMLSFSKIKIDREFVTEVDRRRESQAICQSIIALARGLGIRVLAEGVERWEEYAWLRRHGCTEFQGYYFAPPLSLDDFERYIADQALLAAKLSADARQMQISLTERLVG